LDITSNASNGRYAEDFVHGEDLFAVGRGQIYAIMKLAA
jgi:hypothetical protein